VLALPQAAWPAAGSERPWLAAPSHGEALPLPELDPAVPSPASVLGYPLGSRFTHWSEILRYLEALDAASSRVSLWDYGETYEGRPLKLVAVSSPENLEALEDLRQRHLRLAAPAVLPQAERDALIFTQPVFVWLAFGVHGNESSSAEAAMGTAYLLAAARGEWERRRREAVVLIDPLSNPDGREHYLASFEQRRGRLPDSDPHALEHAEPWPGGRYNHYWIDLNRDWAWATQRETRHRLAAYRLWEPQLYVDFHEMGSGSTYYFPPAAEPIHPAIDRRVVKWLAAFGQANARAFDRLGWLFFERERYDLFYPGYGDSYPSLRGAVGMTYEMAGGGRAGQLVRLPDGSLLSLADRVVRHLASALATVEQAAASRVGLLSDFAASRHGASTRLPLSILWESGQQEARPLADLLALHGIQVQQLSAEAEVAAAPGLGGTEERRRFPAGTFVVSTAQPLSGLVEALLKAKSPLAAEFLERQRRRVEEDLPAELYDVTAWSLPLAFNLTTWLMHGEPAALGPLAPPPGGISGAGEVGFLAAPQGLAGYRFAAGLWREQVRFRLALAGFEAAGERFPPGTLFVPRLGNPGDLDERLARLAAEARVRVKRAASSQTASGISLGSDQMAAVKPPRVTLAIGKGTDPTSAGALWHLLDQDLGLSHRRLALEELTDRLSDCDVLLLPDGSGYGGALGDKGAQALSRWVEAGGVLVAVGGAIDWLSEQKLLPVEISKPGPADEEEPEAGGERAEEELEGPLPRRLLEVPGAILATELRASHLLAAGVASPPPVLFTGSTVLQPAAGEMATVLAVVAEQPVVSGLAWPEAEERLSGALLVGERPLGRGRIFLFAQEPGFRLFWRATMPLLLNAVMYAPSWPESL
jgi:hypothetical protein